MSTGSLEGRSILVYEDEPLVAAGITDALQSAGATVLVAHQVAVAADLLNRSDVDAAVLDWGLSGDDSASLCKQLDGLHVPHVIYSGLSEKPEGCERGVFLLKRANAEQLIETVADLLKA